MDLSKLVERLKGKGLDLAEDAARLVVIETFEWVESEIKESESKLDDLFLAVIPPVKGFVLSQIDKIDSKEG